MDELSAWLVMNHFSPESMGFPIFDQILSHGLSFSGVHPEPKLSARKLQSGFEWQGVSWLQWDTSKDAIPRSEKSLRVK